MIYRVYLRGPDKLIWIDVESSAPPTRAAGAMGSQTTVLGDCVFATDALAAIIPHTAIAN